MTPPCPCPSKRGHVDEVARGEQVVDGERLADLHVIDAVDAELADGGRRGMSLSWPVSASRASVTTSVPSWTLWYPSRSVVRSRVYGYSARSHGPTRQRMVPFGSKTCVIPTLRAE
jgi:hypothetical protein